MTESGLSILLAEDEPAHAEAICRAFAERRAHAKVQVAGTLREYRAMADASPPDIALLDLHLPDGRAVDVLTSPREAGRFPVLIMTSSGDEQHAVEAMKAGALDYIVKSPETFSAMPHTVERALREWALLRERGEHQDRIVHLNAVLRGIRNVNQLITRERDPQTLIQKTCELLVESRGYRTSCIVLCDGARVIASASAGAQAELRSLRQMLAFGQFPSCVREALEDSRVVVRERPAEACEGCPVNRDYSEDRDAAAVRLENEGKTLGALLVSLPPGFASHEEEIDLLKEVATDVAFALRSIEMQAAMEQSAAELTRSRETLRTIFESIQDGIVVASAETRMFEVVNDAICSMLGYTRDQMLTLGVQDIHPQDKLPHVMDQLERQLRGTEGTLATDIPVKRRDGSVFYADVNARRVELEGRPCIVGVFRDMTEQRHLKEQLELAQRLEAVGRLAGGVAHDFNNLLSVIITYASFVAEELGESDPIRADVVEIQNAGQRAAALTRQLLAFSRKQILEPTVLNLNNVVTGIERMLRRLLGEDIDIEVHLADDLGSVMADPGQIEQVLMNLAVNARDAMPRGGKLTIESRNVELDADYADRHIAVKPGSFVMVSVTDAGSGMDAATRERIFEPFFTTKEKGKGTGLGLSTVYGIVKQSGGNIWVYSEPEHGTTFKVYLPRVDAPAAQPNQRPALAMATGSERLLIVEDEDAVRRLAERILQGAGYEVLIAANGADALRLCENHSGAIDLLLTDVVMPQMGGRDLAERLATQCPQLKVLFMSGYTDNAIVHHGVLDPDTRFIGKPFTAAELTRKVREVLDEKDGLRGE